MIMTELQELYIYTWKKPHSSQEEESFSSSEKNSSWLPFWSLEKSRTGILLAKEGLIKEKLGLSVVSLTNLSGIHEGLDFLSS